ncbi:MAG: hypothetical protein GXO80_12070 [Chlorobi bacterium]|nr:hypothetical protein [Chlorobiota bacterium]
MNYEKILEWIDKEMKFDKWYNVKSEEQIKAIKELMDAKFLPDCVFNEDYTKFKKSKAGYDMFLLNKK